MNSIEKGATIGIIGAGTMGTGIAQAAATNGFNVFIYDEASSSIERASEKIKNEFEKLILKNKISETEAHQVKGRIKFIKDLKDFSNSSLIIEAVIEDLKVKQNLFSQLENIVSDNCILATNTSSLSVASIASACNNSSRVVGIHFFNPAHIMPLVEIIPSLTTSEECVKISRTLIENWGKTTVIAKDTPGFIVNKVARPYYGEALRIYDESIADFATIDWAMKEFGKFRMGPFELMDFIGNDINYTVTATVFEQMFYDPRYRPSLTQKRLFDAGFFGRKTGKGYYDYKIGIPEPETNNEKGKLIYERILAMLINEAADTLFLRIATREDIDLAVTKGVNYPKGLLSWADEWGINNVVKKLKELQETYGEDRYRVCPLLNQLNKSGKCFFN